MGHKIYSMEFAVIYDAYVAKVTRKGVDVSLLDKVIVWLSGYDQNELNDILQSNMTMREFFDNAPHINDNANLIKGVICGIRVEDIEDPLMQKIRWLDKLVDEISKGKNIDKVLR